MSRDCPKTEKTSEQRKLFRQKRNNKESKIIIAHSMQETAIN